MKQFTIYQAECFLEEGNTYYPKSCKISSLDELLEAARLDNTCNCYKGSKRSKDNFIKADCSCLDIDNSETDDPAAWITPEKLQEYFPGVQFYVVYSRHHMKVKKKKSGEAQTARPRFHVFYPHAEMNAEDHTKLIKRIARICPYFDPSALDNGRFYYGVKDPKGATMEGSYTIDDFIEDGILLGDIVDADPEPVYSDDFGELDQRQAISWLETWLQDHEIGYDIEHKDKKSFYHVDCPNRQEHTCDTGRKQSSLFVREDGTICYVCQHAHCAGHGWEWFRSEIESTSTKRILYKRNKYGQVVETLDGAVIDDILEKHNIINVERQLYVYDHGVFQRDDDARLVKSMIAEYLPADLLNANRIERIFRLLLMRPNIARSIEELNNHPVWWVNFKNGMLDLKKGQIVPHSVDYLSINQIDHEYNMSYKIPDSSVTKEFIEGLIKDPGDRKMLLQYFGYCLTQDTSAQKMFCITGSGGLGKSVLISIMESAVGEINCCHIRPQDFSDRFSSAFLLGKIFNSYSDIASKDLDDISQIKAATGEDSMRAEYKGGKVFFFKNKCKMFFSANRMPRSTDEGTDAFYRRLLMIRLTERCHEIPALKTRLAADRESFYHLIVDAAREMYTQQAGALYESDRSREEVKRLYCTSDSVQAWLEDRTEGAIRGHFDRKVALNDYQNYCFEEERQAKTANGFYASLREKGYEEVKINGKMCFKGAVLGQVTGQKK